jgi:cell fate regulator YaaT (PSP1 superfamily)
MNNEINNNQQNHRRENPEPPINGATETNGAIAPTPETTNGNGCNGSGGCSCKKRPKVIQDLHQYNDLRIPINLKNDGDSKPPKYVEVLFKCKRKKVYRNDLNLPLEPAQFVIVEIENGIDIGTVYASGKEASDKIDSIYKGVEPERSIIRIATEDDISRNNDNIADAYLALNKAKELAERFELDMKITETEWQYDRQRLTIYFTAPQRIDFRELVKELARMFKTRIELRQISAREEAKRLGGVGPCGRYLCCSSFACEFCHVTLDHARLQQLSNNVAKLSGYCGRLKCCLLYEHETYVDAFKHYPSLQSYIEMPEGQARILKVDIFKDIVYLHVTHKNLYLTINREELAALDKAGKIIRPAREHQAKLGDLDPEKLHELLELEKDF